MQVVVRNQTSVGHHVACAKDRLDGLGRAHRATFVVGNRDVCGIGAFDRGETRLPRLRMPKIHLTAA